MLFISVYVITSVHRMSCNFIYYELIEKYIAIKLPQSFNSSL